MPRKSTPLLCAAIFMCGASFAQTPASHSTGPLKAPLNKGSETSEDWKQEQEHRLFMQKKFARAHSDAAGRVRPDLWDEGVAHIKRMTVVHEIGPVPKDSSEKK